MSREGFTRRELLAGTGGLWVAARPANPDTPTAPAPATADTEPADAAVPRHPLVRQRFVYVDGRRVHYLRAGTGSPVVFAHPTPGTAWMMLPQMEVLAGAHTCFLFDTPGLGLSAPLEIEQPTIHDLADALAAAMAALGLPRCVAYGSASGAAMVLELARRHPERVSGILCDGGVPLFVPEEARRFQDDYTPPIVSDALGGHYSATWTHFRDTSIWLPWYRREPEFATQDDLLSPARLHDMLVTIFHGRRSYRAIVKAVVASGAGAAQSLAALEVPAVILDTPVHPPFLDIGRVSEPNPLREVLRVSADPVEKAAAVRAAAARLDGRGGAPADRDAPRSCTQIETHFVDLPGSQIFLRHCGRLGRPACLLIHDCPGSALRLEPLILALAARADVYALDLPGCGESPPLPIGAPSLDEVASAVAAVADALGLQAARLHGIGFGASVAARVGARPDARFAGTVLQSPLLPTGDERLDLRRHYAPALTTDATGSHWYRMWLMLRDSLIYWPWYTQTAKGRRRTAADFGAEPLHAWTFEVMKQWHSYQHVINAVLDEPDCGLAAPAPRTLVCLDAGHPFAAHSPRVPAAFPGVPVIDVPSDPVAFAALLDHPPGGPT